MAVETTQNGIWNFDTSLPTATDDISEGDDHIRGIKAMVVRTFPNISATANVTAQELNYLSGVTSNVQDQFNDVSASLADVQSQVDALSAQAAVAYGGLNVLATAPATVYTASTSLAAYAEWTTPMISSNVTVNTSAGSLSPDITGIYNVFVSTSFSGDSSVQFSMHLFKDDVDTGFGYQRLLNSNGDIGNANFFGIISANAGAVLKTRLASSAADSAYRLHQGQFAIQRLPS